MITGERLGKVSLDTFNKLVSKADEVLSKAADDEKAAETAELKDKVDFLKKAEPLIRAIDPATAEDGYAPMVMNSLHQFSAFAGVIRVPFDDIVVVALKRAVDDAMARGDWSGAGDLVLSSGSEVDVVSIGTIKDDELRADTKKALFLKLVMAASDEPIPLDVTKSLMKKGAGADIDKDHDEACSCVLRIMSADQDELDATKTQDLSQQLKNVKRPGFLFKAWTKTPKGVAIQDAASKASAVQLQNQACKDAIREMGAAPAFPSVAMDQTCSPWKVSTALRKWLDYAKARRRFDRVSVNGGPRCTPAPQAVPDHLRWSLTIHSM